MGKKIKQPHNTHKMGEQFSDVTLTRKSLPEYAKMKKKEVLASMVSFISNFDKLRYKYIEIQLQNNYLERNRQLLENHIDMLKERIKDLPSKGYRSYKTRK